MYIRLNRVQLADRDAFSQVMTAWSTFMKEEFPHHRGWEVLFGSDGGAMFLRTADSLGAFEKYDEEGKKAYEAYRASGRPDRMAEWLRSYTQESSSIWRLREDRGGGGGGRRGGGGGDRERW